MNHPRQGLFLALPTLFCTSFTPIRGRQHSFNQQTEDMKPVVRSPGFKEPVAQRCKADIKQGWWMCKPLCVLNKTSLSMVAHIYIPSSVSTEQEYCHKFKPRLGCSISFQIS